MTTTSTERWTAEIEGLMGALGILMARRATIDAAMSPTATPTEVKAANDLLASAIARNGLHSMKLDPQVQMLQSFIRNTGERICAAGGLDAMLEVPEAVLDRQGQRAAVKLERLWEGVGNEWWASPSGRT